MSNGRKARMAVQRKVGDLQVWWMPQVPMSNPFEVDVASVADGVMLLKVLADYDRYQYANRIKPDFCNAGGLHRWCADNGEGVAGWEDWYDEDTGDEDPEAWLLAQGVGTLVEA